MQSEDFKNLQNYLESQIPSFFKEAYNRWLEDQSDDLVYVWTNCAEVEMLDKKTTDLANSLQEFWSMVYKLEVSGNLE